MTAGEGQREDRHWMRRALALARRGWGRTAPNPLVGAVLVKDGRVVGAGWHAEFGGPHAEAMALTAAGDAARGATCYVTLEPCAHSGKTPPCADALIRAGVARVVYAVADPNPVAAGGAATLAAAGVHTTGGVEDATARELNAPFLHQAQGAARPFVTLKLAVALDGAIADASRAPRWLTGARARRWVHRARAQSDAIGVGIGTVLADDPLLTVRDEAAPRVAPVRVVFDRTLRLPLRSQLVRTAAEVPVLAVAGAGADPDRRSALLAAGVQVVDGDTMPAALAALHAAGVRHLFCEGGAGIAQALIAASAADRLAIFQAPVALGTGALAAFRHEALPHAGADVRWRLVQHRRLGDDRLTVYAPR
jgi:diaminohydroxyphosphoribosylaminopyrimidine deaminase / 5-amino-6-(5-phosphoribosylamino)uracil reductase